MKNKRSELLLSKLLNDRATKTPWMNMVIEHRSHAATTKSGSIRWVVATSDTIILVYTDIKPYVVYS